MVVRLFVLIAVAVLLAGCGGRDYEASPSPPVSRWKESWRDAEGSVVQEHVVSTGYAECVDAVLLSVGWPLGTPFDTIDSARTYVRDRDGALETVGRLDTDATLPENARNSGYHLGDVQLWFGRNARQAAYVVDGSKVERWPRLVEPVGCV
jgi:hypothetical protein